MRSKIKELYVTFILRLNWMWAWLRCLLLIGVGIASGIYGFFHVIAYVVKPLAENFGDWVVTAETHNSIGSRELLPTITVHLESQWNISIGFLGVREILDWIPFLVIPGLIIWLIFDISNSLVPISTYADKIDDHKHSKQKRQWDNEDR